MYIYIHSFCVKKRKEILFIYIYTSTYIYKAYKYTHTQSDMNKELEPKETLYVNNLNEKISIEDMKYALYFLFMQYGEVVEIVCKKNSLLRG